MSIGMWAGSLKSDITDTKKDFYNAMANTRNDLHDKLNLMIQGEAQMMKTLIDTTQQGREAKTAEVKARAECRRTGTGVGAAKPPKFDGTKSWAMFQHQFKTTAEHDCWMHQEKSTYWITALQGWVTNMLH
jgi:hypothetical protein